MNKKYVCDKVSSTVSEFLSARCIIIYGSDSFQRDQCYKYIMKTIDFQRKQTSGQPLNDGVDSFQFYGDDVPAKDKNIFPIMEALNSFSFDLSEKVITIKNLEGLNSEATKKIAKYAENPSPYAKLIMISEKLDSRLSATQALLRHCLAFETTEMKYQSHLNQWLNQYLSQNRINMDYPARQLFTTIVQPDAFTAYNEMKKLELYVGSGNKITEKDIRECTVNSKIFTPFDLVDAIGFKDKVKALEIGEYLTKNDDSLVMLITLLSNLFFTLMRLNALLRKNVSQNDLKDKYMSEIYHSFRDKYLTFLKNYNQNQIQAALKSLYDCDCKVKLSMAEDLVLVTALVLEVLRK